MNNILTGDRPTGKLHLGHYVGTLKERLIAQDSEKYDNIFIMIADAQALTDNADDVEKVRESVIEVAKYYLSVGLDPTKVTIFIQSQVPALPELTSYFMNLVTVNKVEKNPTVKEEIRQKGIEESIPVGFQCYPIAQAADILAFNAKWIPAGQDQEPMIELTRYISKRLKNLFGIDFHQPEIILPDSESSYRLPGLDGNGKMSKSLNNAIYLSDDSDTVLSKVMSAYTDPNHINLNDPGKIEGNVVFDYLDVFAQKKHFEMFLPKYNSLDDLKARYTRGGVGDVEIKRFLANIINEFLEPIRVSRYNLDNEEEKVWEILKAGTIKANRIANKNLKIIKDYMGINYFS